MIREAASDPARGRHHRFALPPAHRLKRRRLIRALFDRSSQDVRSVASGCIRAVYRFVDEPPVTVDAPLQVGVFVSRRTGGAVRRNRIRRRIREAYRRRHPELYGALSGRNDLLTLGLLFRGQPDVTWQTLRSDVDRTVDELIGRLSRSPAEARDP